PAMLWVLSSRGAVPEFYQEPPALGNQYDDDRPLRALLERLLPETVLGEIAPELTALGGRVAGDILRLGDDAEASPPRHIPFDAWGRRVDRIDVRDAGRGPQGMSGDDG